MTLTELRYIVAVARARHFGKAAEECFVSQPTLSVGIRKLEDSLGVTIFERGRSEVKITPIGELIIKQAEHVLIETNVIKNLADAEKDQLKKPINIGSTYTIGKYLFPEILKSAYLKAPKLILSFSQDYQENLLSRLAKRELDLLILSNIKLSSDNTNEQSDANVSTEYSAYDFMSMPLFQESLYLVASNASSFINRQSISLNTLNISHLYWLNKNHALHQQFIDLNPDWQEQYSSINHSGFDTLESLYQTIRLKNGATIIPESFKNEFIDEGCTDIKIIPFSDPKPSRELNLVWRKDFTRNQVIDLLKECFS